MVSRFGNKNFLAAHYDWIVAGLGLLALAGGAAMFVMSMGADPEEAAAEEVARIARLDRGETGVKAVDMSEYQEALRLVRSPKTLAEVSEKQGNFLTSERRVLCKCKKVIPGDTKAFPKCPYCGEQQEEEKVVVVDADQDGMPDDWEKKFGFNIADAADAEQDADKDGFTNLEEFLAKTDPLNPNDHPDYLDSLSIVLPLQETKMPFAFVTANQIPGGWRCEFLDPSRRNDYGKLGRKVTVKVGEKIVDASDAKNPVDYGWTLKSYTAKSEKREKKGMKGMFVTVDVSEVVLERERDGKVMTLVLQPIKGMKLAAVDVKATLAYNRGEVRNLDVVPGSEIDLNGSKYRITDITPVGKGAKVTLESVLSGKKRTLEALER